MYKSSLCKRIADCVMEACECDEDIKSNSVGAVDARYIIVNILSQSGYTNSEIGHYLNLSRQRVYYLQSNFDIRRAKGGYAFEIVYMRAKKLSVKIKEQIATDI